MWDTIKKLEYRAQANLPGAKEELTSRLTDRMELPLSGLLGEKLYLTGVSQLNTKATELDTRKIALTNCSMICRTPWRLPTKQWWMC